MCKLVTVIKKNNKNDDLIIESIKAQEKTIRREPHGMCALAINQDNNKVEIIKEMDNYTKVLEWAYSKVKNSKVVSIHSRQATSGKIDKSNLHFFKADEYYLAHNGIVAGYCGEKKQAKWAPMGSYYYEKKSPYIISDDKEVDKNKICDSYQFLLDIKKPVKEEDILELMSKKDFYGVGIIVDSKRKILYTFATREIPMHTNMKDYTIEYSFDPTNKMETTKDFMGFDIKSKKEDIVSLNKEKALEGIYRYDY